MALTEKDYFDGNMAPVLDKNDIMLLWLTRLMVPLGGYKSLLREKDFLNDAVAEAMGFGKYIAGDDTSKYSLATVRKELFLLWKLAEKMKPSFCHKELALKNNVYALCKMIGLNNTEADILYFSALAKINPILEFGVCSNGNQTASSLESLFSICLDLPREEVRRALLPTSTLSMSGLLWLDVGGTYDFSGKVELLKGLVDELHIHHDDPGKILRSIVHPSTSPKLTEADYGHLNAEITLLSDYLATATSQSQRGVNVLLYGVPGSGKTEFVRMLAKKCRLNLFEVASGGRMNGPLESEARLRAYHLGQKLCESQSQTAILFDEVEDVFVDPDIASVTGQLGNKGWFNHTLETNPVPAFWVSNSLDNIDPAYLRRFDFVLELNAPPRSIREKIISDYLGDLPVSANWKRQLAENSALVPSIVERATKVVLNVGRALSQQEAEESLEKIMGNTMEAMGYRRIAIKHGTSLEYRLDVLNADHDIAMLCEGLKVHPQARICLFGPPGTGKTAFGKYIAEFLDMPLLSKRASDILGPYVGMTESNMADMFRQAQDEHSVLLLDEADSFLQERQNAHHNWEVSAVNEMLTQMESYEGVFIASTNLMSALDTAAMRRFDVKLKFDYLKPEQIWSLFATLAESLGFSSFDDLKKRLIKLNYVTPGDFATVSRKLRLVKAKTPEHLAEMIESECFAKASAQKRAIGF